MKISFSISTFLCGIFCFLQIPVFAQVQLVKDINTAAAAYPSNSFPGKFININGTFYFGAGNGAGGGGGKLWKSDGTTNGTVMVKDIFTGIFTNVNGTLFFGADDGIHGSELWKSDGTPSGTVMVKDINPGSSGGFSGRCVAIGSILYFSATDGTNGFELWKSDGTPGGTVMIKDINPGINNSNPWYLTNVNGTLFFSADDGTNGVELWKSNGTTIGTTLVKDIYPGASGSGPYSLINVNGTLFFDAADATNGLELWKSNGTTIGTQLVKDINPGAGNGFAQNLVNFNNTLIFSADDGTNGRELWKSDGSTGGTVMINDINPGVGASNPGSFTSVGSILYFTATDGTSGTELYLTDGSPGGTGLVKDIYPGTNSSGPNYLANVNGILFFTAYDGTNGNELWRSDGTTGGTIMIKDIYPGAQGSDISEITSGGTFAVFSADEPSSGYEVWESDGTPGGTFLLKNINPDLADPSIDDITAAGSKIFFSAGDGINGYEPWQSDGSTIGTSIAKDIYPGAGDSYPGYFTAINDTVYFGADDGTNGNELWKSNGTTARTLMVKDIEPGISQSYPEFLTDVNDTLYFFANQSTTGYELWKSDGTIGGTTMIKDINPGTGSSMYSTERSDYVNINGKFYFPAADGTNGAEPWISDGTSAGTHMLADINTTCGSCGSNPSGFTYVNGAIFFSANDGIGSGLWKTDGTNAGTVLVKDTVYPSFLINVNGTLFFKGQDATHGVELWKSDGTTGGTVMVKDIYPGNVSYPAPNNFVSVNGILYFTADDSIHGRELWKSDGTPGGTVMVKDIYPGSVGSSPLYPASFVNFHDTLFFTATDGVYGVELWTSTGTAAGTARVSDIYSGVSSSQPDKLTVAGNTLFFTADDGILGNALWKLTMPVSLTTTTSVTNVSCYGLNNGAIDLTIAGGTPPYTFLWSNNATTQNISGLAVGTFSVSILDTWGWTKVNFFSVTQPALLTVAPVSQQSGACNGGNNGSINISVLGGTTPYIFNWSPGGTTTQNISGLTANNYSVLITDAHSCTNTFSTTLSQPPALSVSVTPTNVSCHGGSDGTATANPSGGTSPYSYLWNNSQTSQTATALSATTYSVTITDANGCTISASANITQPGILSSSTSVISHASCYNNDGSASVTAGGGVYPYLYSWSTGNTTSAATALGSGSYTVVITDANGCMISDLVVINNSVTSSPLPICAVTVDSLSKYNLIVWNKASYLIADTFFVYRDTANNNYAIIGKVPYNSLSQFTDTVRTLYAANGDPNSTTWKYKIAVKDTCGNISAKSPYHKTLFIQNNSGNFTWNDYLIEGQQVPVPALSNYLFQRDNLSNGNWQTIQTLSASSLAYTDPAYSTYQSTGAWRVKTVWNISCMPTLIKDPVPDATTINNSKSNTFKTNATTSVNESSFESSVSIFPNPNSGQFTVYGLQSQVELSVYNTFGEKVYSGKNINSKSFVLNLNLANGIYFAHIKTERGTVMKKIVIVN